MQTGLAITLRFVAEAKFFSGLINRGTSDIGYSHVGAITTAYIAGKPVLCEFGARARPAGAAKAGVQYRPADYATFTRETLVAIPATRHEYDAFWMQARNILGRPYSWRTLLGFAIGRNVPEDGGVAFDCSTAMGWLLLHCGILAPALRERLRQISPNALYPVAEQLAHDRRNRCQ